MKVVQNVIMMSDSQKILSQKFLWTAKEPTLVFVDGVSKRLLEPYTLKLLRACI